MTGKDGEVSAMPILSFVLGCPLMLPSNTLECLPSPLLLDEPTFRRPCRRRLAGDGSVPRNQGGQPGLPAVLPDGRFLRVVLRGCGRRIAGPGHRTDQTWA